MSGVGVGGMPGAEERCFGLIGLRPVKVREGNGFCDLGSNVEYDTFFFLIPDLVPLLEHSCQGWIFTVSCCYFVMFHD